MSENSIKQVFIRDGEEFIRLGQALKKCGAVSSGVDAKFIIQDGDVRVNGEAETRRGRKLRDGDLIEYGELVIKVVSDARTETKEP